LKICKLNKALLFISPNNEEEMIKPNLDNKLYKTKLPRMTAQLMSMVITEVIKRLMSKKNMLHEPLEQIVLNKYTVIKFLKEEKKEKRKENGKVKKST